MSSSSEPIRERRASSTDIRRRPTAEVLRAEQAAGIALAPLDTDLRMASSVMRSIDPSRIEAAIEQGRNDGYAEGFDTGFEKGLAAGRSAAATEAADGRRRLATAVDALKQAATTVAAAQALQLRSVEEQLVDAALVLAEAVLGRELATSTSPGRDALARGLALTPAGSAVVARLHPDDALTIDGALDVDLGRDVTVVADPSVGKGGCIIEAGDARIDAQLSSALARAGAVLRGAS